MADLAAVSSDDALAFMVSAGLVYEIVAAACSSPQTTEINAASRSATLMKWVKLGLAQAALFVLIAAWLARRGRARAAALLGGALASVIMWLSYVHARQAGLASAEPGTEGGF